MINILGVLGRGRGTGLLPSVGLRLMGVRGWAGVDGGRSSGVEGARLRGAGDEGVGGARGRTGGIRGLGVGRRARGATSVRRGEGIVRHVGQSEEVLVYCHLEPSADTCTVGFQCDIAMGARRTLYRSRTLLIAIEDTSTERCAVCDGQTWASDTRYRVVGGVWPALLPSAVTQ